MLLSLLSACGYHLRGGEASILAGARIALESKQPNGEFEKQLTKRLKRAGAQLDFSGQPAQFSLEIIDLEITFQGVSRDQSGRANEQIVSARLSYLWLALSDNDNANANASPGPGREISEPQTLTVSANYVQDYINPIGEETQKKQTRRLLLEKLSQQLVQRLQRLTQNATN